VYFFIDVDARAKGKETHARPASNEELQAALEIAQKLKKYIENEYAAVGFIAYSGNGFHLLFPLPFTPLEGEAYREEINEKLKQFTKNISAKNNVTVDTLDYTRRVTTLIGSYNLKLPENPIETRLFLELGSDIQNRKEVIARARAQNSKLLKAILENELTPKTTAQISNTTKPHPKLDTLLKMDLKLNDMFNGDFQKHTGDNDRSDAEMSIVCSLIGYGFSDQEIEEAMLSCHIGEWQEKNDSYHTRTITQAHKWISEQKAKEPTKEETKIIKIYTSGCDEQGKPKGKDEYWQKKLDEAQTKGCTKIAKEWPDSIELANPNNRHKNKEEKTKESQADRLYSIFTSKNMELFQDQNKTEYARLPIDLGNTNDANDINGISANCKPLNIFENSTGGKTDGETAPIVCENTVNTVNTVSGFEIVRLNNEKFKTYLARSLYVAEGKVANKESISQVILLLKYDASHAQRYILYNRVAPDPSGDGSILLDMADAQNRAYHIARDGWTIETNVPLLFRRYDHQRPLVEAVKEGKVNALLEYVNIGASKTSELTKLCQLLLIIQTAYLIPNIAHPINAMFGCPGSHKSCAQRYITEIFEPSATTLLRKPRDENDALQVLDHHYIPIFDNLDSLPRWFSDMLCGAVTGAGQESRALYTIEDSFIRAFRRRVMLNGLNLPATKGDLLNRTIMHPTEPNVERRTEEELDKKISN